MTKILFLLLLPVLLAGERPEPPVWLLDPVGALQEYRQNLTHLRPQYPTQDSLPDLHFFLFGMGNRMKLIYRDGRLLNARTGNIERQWDVQEEIIVPSEYTVQLELRPTPGSLAQTVQIREDEAGVWILQTGQRTRLIRGTRSPVNLPRFDVDKNGPVLRVLLQEVLMNVFDGKLLTNFLVFDQPIPPDAARMQAVLSATGNDALSHTKTLSTSDTTALSTGTNSAIGTGDYPLSWQRNAPGAHYPGLTMLEKILVKQRLVLPHAGRTAGLFLDLSGRQ